MCFVQKWVMAPRGVSLIYGGYNFDPWVVVGSISATYTPLYISIRTQHRFPIHLQDTFLILYYLQFVYFSIFSISIYSICSFSIPIMYLSSHKCHNQSSVAVLRVDVVHRFVDRVCRHGWVVALIMSNWGMSNSNWSICDLFGYV